MREDVECERRLQKKKKKQGGELQNYHVDAKERAQYEGN